MLPEKKEAWTEHILQILHNHQITPGELRLCLILATRKFKETKSTEG